MDLFEQMYAGRSGSSIFFHFLNWSLRHRRICDNILLAHEGDCPLWVADIGEQTLVLILLKDSQILYWLIVT